jgi:hypothetical protein
MNDKNDLDEKFNEYKKECDNLLKTLCDKNTLYFFEKNSPDTFNKILEFKDKIGLKIPRKFEFEADVSNMIGLHNLCFHYPDNISIIEPGKYKITMEEIIE